MSLSVDIYHVTLMGMMFLIVRLLTCYHIEPAGILFCRFFVGYMSNDKKINNACLINRI